MFLVIVVFLQHLPLIVLPPPRKKKKKKRKKKQRDMERSFFFHSVSIQVLQQKKKTWNCSRHTATCSQYCSLASCKIKKRIIFTRGSRGSRDLYVRQYKNLQQYIEREQRQKTNNKTKQDTHLPTCCLHHHNKRTLSNIA